MNRRDFGKMFGGALAGLFGAKLVKDTTAQSNAIEPSPDLPRNAVVMTGMPCTAGSTVQVWYRYDATGQQWSWTGSSWSA